MGADIHLVLERRLPEEAGWVAVDLFGYHRSTKGEAQFPAARSRNYQRFAALAGVRGDGPNPRGFPEDASQSARHLFEKWGDDAHSASWLPIDEAVRVFLATEYLPFAEGSWEATYPTSHYFNTESDPGMHRLVFWFDN